MILATTNLKEMPKNYLECINTFFNPPCMNSQNVTESSTLCFLECHNNNKRPKNCPLMQVDDLGLNKDTKKD